MACGAWSALLTFVGAFFIDRLEVREAVVGWLLAGGAAAYLAASTRRAGITGAIPAGSWSLRSPCFMAILFAVQHNVAGSVAFAAGIFC